MYSLQGSRQPPDLRHAVCHPQSMLFDGIEGSAARPGEVTHKTEVRGWCRLVAVLDVKAFSEAKRRGRGWEVDAADKGREIVRHDDAEHEWCSNHTEHLLDQHGSVCQGKLC